MLSKDDTKGTGTGKFQRRREKAKGGTADAIDATDATVESEEGERRGRGEW